MTKYLKAFYGAAATGLGAVAVAYSDNVITNQEWVTVAIATLGSLGVVWAVPNKAAASAILSLPSWSPKAPVGVAAPSSMNPLAPAPAPAPAPVPPTA